MKKALTVFTALLLFFTGTALAEKKGETAPAQLEGETLIDLDSINGKTKDNVRFISGIEESQSFVLKYYDSAKGEWAVFGSAKTVGFGDTDFISSKIHIRKHRWYSVSSDKKTPYTYKPYAHNNDLYISVWPATPEAAPDKSRATIIDAKGLKGSFRDNIRILNNTSTVNPSFVVYGFNSESDEWVKIGNAAPKKINEDAMVRSPYDYVNNFNYYAVISKDGNEYSYSAQKKDHDLFVKAKDR